MATSNTDTKRKIKEMPPSPHIVYISDTGEALKTPPVTGGNLSEGSYTKEGSPSESLHTKKGNSSEKSQGYLDANLCFRAMRECLKPIDTSINTFRASNPTMYKVGCTMLITTCILGLGIGLTAATLGIAPAAVAMATGAGIAWHAITGAAVVAGPKIAHAATTTGSSITAHRVAAASGAGGLMLAGLGAWGFLRSKKKAKKDAALEESIRQVVHSSNKSNPWKLC